jgi:hypothetical protein
VLLGNGRGPSIDVSDGHCVFAIGHDVIRHEDLVLNPQPKRRSSTSVGVEGRPLSLERPPANRRWRPARSWLTQVEWMSARSDSDTDTDARTGSVVA